MSEASPAIESFIDETIKRSREHNYYPTKFISMRTQYGTVSAIKRLVNSGDIQSGFKRLKDLGLIDWTIEAAVLKFPDEFPASIVDAARWRLDQAKASNSKS